jgi:diguanylate cyclase (GGDEF)-like protein
MLRVYGCFVTQHDLRLVALAAVICAAASYTAITLLHHVCGSEDRMRRLWLCVAAVATGFGIWATHFIAMLAFEPGIPSGYNIALTILSLIAAIGLTGVGLAIAVSPKIPSAREIGGAVVGGGIAAMHYTGMAAFEIAGRIEWDPGLVAVSIAFGGLFGISALPIGLADNKVRWKAPGAVMLTVAICSHHFTAMGAAVIIPDPTKGVSDFAIPEAWLAIGVALASITIILLTFLGLALDLRERRRASEELDRMRDLADAAVEGLIVCDGETIVAANRSFRTLSCGGASIIGRELATFFSSRVIREQLLSGSSQPVELEMRAMNGESVTVELIQREITYAGRPHRALAVRDVRGRKKAEQRIHFLAHHDPLTALPNRVSFKKRLEAEIAAHRSSGKRFAVLYLDLDRFKEVNDLFGHPAGDVVLQSIAGRIADVLKPDQMGARLGGDEFAVIAPNLSAATDAGRFAETLIEAIRMPVEEEVIPATATSGASIGVAIYPDDATEPDLLLSHADAALYEAKTAGGGTYRFFEAAIGASLLERRQLEHDLRQATARDELSLVYQPQVRLNSDEVLGFEALLRWQHGTSGFISPGTFIPIAEECGAILQIGEWVLRTACAEAAAWPKPLTIAVNVSTVQLHKSDLPRLVHEILLSTGLAPHRLELEITETALVTDFDRALAALRQLKALGVKIAMDDFGTGYSSLSTLRAFPFDKIKIDGSFVRSVDANEQSAAIFRAVVGLGRGLKLPVLAEGVETTDELNFLRLEHCDEAQGYLLGRPQPMHMFRHLVADGKGDQSAQLPPPRQTIARRA